MTASDRIIADHLAEHAPPLAAADVPSARTIIDRRNRRRLILRGTTAGMVTACVCAAGFIFRAGSDQAVILPDQDSLRTHDLASTTGTVESSADVWQLDFGAPDDTGRIPLMLSRASAPDSATSVGMIQPVRVREVPLWQLEPRFQDEIQKAWTEAGFQPSHQL